ncbi:hypothetical protein ACIBEF_05360 [Micromonospora sp. NPDC050795]|uniref:hypothetical protein n=1 Tax=Micromonospora sp. NPDC050795 TaxID=3364282 RepID=UPI0037B118F7
MTAGPRRAVRRGLIVLLVLLGVSGWTYVAIGDRWKSNVAFFTLDEGDNYRLRVTGSFDVRCAKLERETFSDPYVNWREAGKDCAWPRVADGDGWLAGGRVEQVHSERLGRRLPEAILYGIVPAAATSIQITLGDGTPREAATIASGHDAYRVYAVYVPDAGDRVEVVSLRLHDAQGGDLLVY